VLVTEPVYDNFWAAFKALDMKNESEIQGGLQLAKKVQQFVISLAGYAFNGKGVQSLGNIRVFNMCSLRSQHDVSLGRHSSFIGRLAQFFQDCYMQQTGQQLPFIVVGPPNTQDQHYCQMVGINSTLPLDDKKNVFPSIIIKAAETIGAKYRLEAFDRRVVDIASDDVEELLGYLDANIK